MQVTENQLILAAICGVAGTAAAYLPFVGVLTNYMSKDKSQLTDMSIWTFLVSAMVTQFLVGVLFYYAILIFDTIIKSPELKLLGVGGGFDLFWKVPVIDSPTTAQTWTVMIDGIRKMVVLLNAFIAPMAVVGGFTMGYTIANEQLRARGTSEANSDFFMLAFKPFLGVLIAVVVYVGWAKMASYSMMIPSAIEGQNATLIEASQAWWRKSLEINGGKNAADIRF